jgi:hypothetical protein
LVFNRVCVVSRVAIGVALASVLDRIGVRSIADIKGGVSKRSKSSRTFAVSWLSRGPDSSGEAWIGCKRLILKLSQVILAMEVKGPYMHSNRRLTLIHKWCDTRDFQLTFASSQAKIVAFISSFAF